jgi:Gluconate 2-dehydrogenase subunit 3
MYNRREFLIHSVCLAALSRAMRAFANHPDEFGAAPEFAAADLQMLGAAMDEVIPAGDGMPSATAAGGLHYVHYLGWQYSSIQQEISRFLEMLGQRSAARFGTNFLKLRPDQRLQLLTAIEREQPSVFSSFVGYVYESYYTQPRVLGLISCALPSLPTEDDEELLGPVRKLAHPYREVR